MIEKTRQAGGLGVFYWEPIAHGSFTSYCKGAWDFDDSPSIAMDAFINKETLSVDNFEIENMQLFTAFPNPSKSSITVNALKDHITWIEIYDITGKQIRKIKGESVSKTIDISQFQSGIYLLKINNSKSIKFLKN